jgi:hypothetical protein
MVKVWDAVSGQETLVLRHEDTVVSVAFSPEGRRLATTMLRHEAGTTRLWEIGPPPEPVEQLAALEEELAALRRRQKQLSPAVVEAQAHRRGREVGTGRWRIDGQEIVQDTQGPGPAWLFFGDPAWTDYDFDLEVQRIAGREGAGIVVRAAEPEKLYLVNLGGWGNESFAVESLTDGNWQTHSPKPPGGLEPGRWYRVRVEVRGEHFRCLLDGKPILEATDGQHARGCVGLRSWDTANRFRNLKVTDPQGKVLWEGLPTLRPTEHEQLADRAERIQQRINSLKARVEP